MDSFTLTESSLQMTVIWNKGVHTDIDDLQSDFQVVCVAG